MYRGGIIGWKYFNILWDILLLHLITIVHDHDETEGLRVKHNVARLYYATFNEDGHLKILRANVPIKDHEGFVNTTSPIFDIRLCNISTEGLHTENIAFDDLRYNGDMYHGGESTVITFFVCLIFTMNSLEKNDIFSCSLLSR